MFIGIGTPIPTIANLPGSSRPGGGSGGGGGLDQIANNYSMEFNGVDDFIDIGSVSFGVNSTLSFWCFYTSNDSVLFGNGSYYTVYFLGTSVYYRSGGQLWSSVLTKDTWLHLAFVRSGDIVELFINGVSQGTNTGNGTTTPTTITTIGAKATSQYFYEGKIDEVAFWNTALEASDVQAIYDATDTNLTADLSLMATPPVAWYRMGD